MKTLAFLATLAALAAAPAATAQSHHDHPAASQASSAAMADGEVRKVDRDAGKVTLKHGYIKSLDMPPMTMVFQVKDRAVLDRLKAGDKVRFAAEEKAGAYVVTAIEPAK
ncbi:MAG: copper-binding protein [Burkholderiales bacterium]|jgi:Cu(I)/Ag(I) efflux system protein CusF|nr:copper-binding protein [Burkholderiales bacterium]